MTPGRRGGRGGQPGARGRNPAHGRGGNSRRGQVPFPWDGQAHDARITANYQQIQTDAHTAALNGVRPSSTLVLKWHTQSVEGVPLAEPWVKGHYRGQAPPTSRLYGYVNEVGGVPGAPAHDVIRRVRETFEDLNRRLDAIDARIAGGESVLDVYADVLATCAWLHGEWVRIHPFADHNGSTARLMTVMVGLRYGVPLNLPGKPRSALPSAGLLLDYNIASGNQMHGDDQLMVLFLDRSVRAGLAPPPGPQPGPGP
ncbi:hypothetical protein GCM10009845_21950 [Pedococcus bigeumensis]